MKGVSEGKWRWVVTVLVCTVCACNLFFLSEWLIFMSLMASDDCSDAKVILSLVFEFPVKSM